MFEQKLEKVKKHNCLVLNEDQLNTLLTYKNLVITKEKYEKSIERIKKKYFHSLNKSISQDNMTINDLAKDKWKMIVKKYTGFNVTLRNSTFENLSHILIVEKEKE